MREKIMEDLNPLIADLITKAKSGRFQGKEETHRLRIAYINALAGLLRVYNQMSKEKEIEEILERLEALENGENKNDKE